MAAAVVLLGQLGALMVVPLTLAADRPKRKNGPSECDEPLSKFAFERA